MPVILQVPEKEAIEGDAKETKIQYIPACIEGDGQANVTKYFDSYTDKDHSSGEAQILMNAYRGYPLKGCEFKVPDNKIGVIYREPHKLTSEKSQRNLKLGGTFDKFTYWNYDVNPSANDALRKVLGGLDVLEAVHKKIEAD